jgi:hypothetical protein
LWAGWLVLRRGSKRDRFRGWHLAAALAAIALAYIPMVSYLLRGLRGPEGLGSGPAPHWTLAQLPGALRLFSGGNELGVAIYLLLFVIGVGWMAINSRETLALTALWILLPAIAVLSPPFGHQVFMRYFLVGLPVYLLVVATGLTRTVQWVCVRLAGPPAGARRRAATTVLAAGAAAVLLIGIGWPSIASYYAETKQNWRAATWLVQDLAQPGDKVFVRHLYHQAGVRFYAKQRAQGLDLARDGTVLLIPADPGTPFPLAEGQAGWLIVPDQEEFQPGGNLARALPNHTLLEPTVFRPANKPKDSRMIAPISFRTLAVVPVVPARPPSIRFWADREQLAAGECTWLRWEVDNVRELYLDGEGVVGHDSRQVCPTAAAVYRLEAVLLDGRRSSAAVEIGVDAP